MEKEKNRQLGEWICEIAKGNTDAIELIYRRIRKVMFAIAYSYLKNREDSEEVVQEALLTIVRKASSFKENKNAYSWINSIVQNIAKNWIQKRKRQRVADVLAVQELYTEQNESFLFIQEILSKLTKQERKLIIYKYWYELSLSEIALTVHKPRSTVKYTIDKIEERLKEFYHSDI